MNDRDEEAFGRALVAAYPNLLRFAERLAGNRAEAADLVQDTIERALRCRERFQYGSEIGSWLTTILRRIFIDRCRHARVAGRLPRHRDLLHVTPSEDPSPPPAWESFSLEDVRRGLLFLKPEFRLVFEMFAFERLSYVEIGRRLSMRVGTVATRVFRARKQLCGLLLSGEFRLRAVAAGTPAASSPPRQAEAPVRSVPALPGQPDAASRTVRKVA
jgi:RNA polymerase sigma-70 factor (ECF subfamily)